MAKSNIISLNDYVPYNITTTDTDEPILEQPIEADKPTFQWNKNEIDYTIDLWTNAEKVIDEIHRSKYGYLLYYVGIGHPCINGWTDFPMDKRKADIINIENYLYQEVLVGNEEYIKPLCDLIFACNCLNDAVTVNEGDFNIFVNSPSIEAYLLTSYEKHTQRAITLVKEAKTKRSRYNKTANTSQEAAIKELKKQLSEMTLLLNKLTTNIG